jgi:hypothetical protein
MALPCGSPKNRVCSSVYFSAASPSRCTARHTVIVGTSIPKKSNMSCAASSYGTTMRIPVNPGSQSGSTRSPVPDDPGAIGA